LSGHLTVDAVLSLTLVAEASTPRGFEPRSSPGAEVGGRPRAALVHYLFSACRKSSGHSSRRVSKQRVEIAKNPALSIGNGLTQLFGQPIIALSGDDRVAEDLSPSRMRKKDRFSLD